ncbi:MAG: hypothetical protein V1917_02255 [Candidatus Gottesmanbacteria bacterium]
MKQKIFPILIFAFVLFSFFPTFYELKRSDALPTDRSFELIHNYITDYNFYLSRIRQGWEGRTTVLETYTNEPHRGTIIHELYLLLGQLARFIPEASSAVPYAYHVARAVFGVLVLSLIAWLTTLLFKRVFWQVIAFLLVVTAAGWPMISAVGSTWRFNNFMPWWTVLEPLQRITFIPHILVAQAGLLFLVMAGCHPDKRWVLLGIIAMLTGLAMPQALMTVYGVYVLLSVIEYVLEKKTDGIIPRIRIGVLSVWTILYFLPLLSQYPWKRLVDFEVLHPITFSYIEYLKTLGVSLPIGFFGAGIALWRKDKKWYPIVAWAIGVPLVVLLMFIKPLQHPLRFTEMAVYIPLGLLTAYACMTGFQMLQKKKVNPIIGSIGMTFPFLFIIYGGMAMYHQCLWQKDFTNMKVRAGWPVIAMDNYIVYPTKGFIDAITFIDRETPKDTVVLSAIVAGNYIPARTGRRVYLGHENTSYKEEKLEIVKQFYSGKMSEKDAYIWIRRERISYVFWGPQEKEEGGYVDIAATYPYLRQVFVNTEATVYQITP